MKNITVNTVTIKMQLSFKIMLIFWGRPRLGGGGCVGVGVGGGVLGGGGGGVWSSIPGVGVVARPVQNEVVL